VQHYYLIELIAQERRDELLREAAHEQLVQEAIQAHNQGQRRANWFARATALLVVTAGLRPRTAAD
jgi:hypothetical protein